MTEAEYHIFYYLILLTFFIFAGILQQFRNDRLDNFPYCLLLIISVAALVGPRELNIGTDTSQYLDWFREWTRLTPREVDQLFEFGGDPIFKLMARFFGKNLSYPIFLTAVSLTISTLNYLFARGAVKAAGEGSITILFIILMSSSITWNEQTNIMRAGVGTAFLLMFLISLYNRKIYWCIIFGLLALGNHFSTAFFIAFALFASFVKLNLKVYVWMFFIMLGLAIAEVSVISLGVLSGIDFGRIDVYTKNMQMFEYETGFRVTFAIYNTGFLLLALWLRKYLGNFGEFILKFYILSSMLFFFWFSMPFSDRMGAFSWTVIPVIYYLPLVTKFKKMPPVTIAAAVAYGVAGFLISGAHY